MSGSWAAALGQLIPLALVVVMSPLTIIPAIVALASITLSSMKPIHPYFTPNK